MARAPKTTAEPKGTPDDPYLYSDGSPIAYNDGETEEQYRARYAALVAAPPSGETPVPPVVVPPVTTPMGGASDTGGQNAGDGGNQTADAVSAGTSGSPVETLKPGEPTGAVPGEGSPPGSENLAKPLEGGGIDPAHTPSGEKPEPDPADVGHGEVPPVVPPVPPVPSTPPIADDTAKGGETIPSTPAEAQPGGMTDELPVADVGMFDKDGNITSNVPTDYANMDEYVQAQKALGDKVTADHAAAKTPTGEELAQKQAEEAEQNAVDELSFDDRLRRIEAGLGLRSPKLKE